ncbi:solute carrier organic anion transporter family member 4A1-like isoform X2 [Mercenaria mercenaria]|uniref:solute carrier organic anion transporter family member 4A1-like isoform X2 n=1 Tax=Mercenaria mercenaria TaxID=6596 RepID=UPI00234E4568|nr:solute carrier organic anion transporter family member 4A1-like isoform X2 [Mercenaria mercenaria]
MEEQDPFLEQVPGTVAEMEDTREGEIKKQEDVADEKYGCLAFKPSCLQCMNNIRCHVIWQCVFNFFEGFIVNGVINVVLVALEKRYSLPSSKSGLIASSNDFGSIICSVLVGYFGEQRHKPRLIGTGVLIMAAGCLVFSLPHFIGNNYHYTLSTENATENTCKIGSNTTGSCGSLGVDYVPESYTMSYALLMIGNILLGIGASPMFTIGLSYIDENCKAKLTAFYISWTFCAAAVGVAIGYVVGGQTLSLFVDINKVDPASVPLTPMDPQWVGAWWIAPLIALLGFLVVVMPLYGYPRRLPSYTEVQIQRAVEAHGGGDEITAQANFGKSWKDFPRSVWLLVTNPTYVFICCGAAVEALIIGGMATFGAKLIQEKFNVDITWAGTVMGIITIPGSGGGMLLGGYLVKKFQLKCRGIIRMCAGFMLAAFCFGPFLLAHCSSDPFAGLDHAYIVEKSASGLVSSCNLDCGCSTEGFEPVCVQDVVYFSPCHAGCLSIDTQNGVKDYFNCSCLTSTTMTNYTSDYSMTPGLCSGRCAWVWVFCVLFLVVMILTFATMSPGVTALFRCVPDKQRSVGIGVNLLFVRLVGTTPGPILLGAIIDSTCTIWQDTCGTQGSCWVYDKSTMGIRIMLWFMVLKMCGFLLFLIASIVYKPPPKESTDQTVKVSHVSNISNEQATFTKL